MNKALIGLVILLLLLTGCAPTMYCHPIKNPSDFDTDKYDCENMAYAMAHNFGASGNVFIIISETRECLERKHGWKPCNQ